MFLLAHNILIVDDMLINRKLIKSVIKKLPDVVFYEAADGFEAIALVKEKDIDLIILDLMMPGKDGFQVLQELKEDVRYEEIPVIVYSAIDGVDSINQALESGAYDYFTKPLTPQQMKFIVPAKVRNALESYRQRKTILQMNEKIRLELMLANLFQQSLMVESKEYTKALMYGKYTPCNEIGGDFYDCHEIGDSVWFIIADVSGHGVASAMISSMIQVEFNNCIQKFTSPAEVICQMNETFYRITQGNHYLTAFVGMIKDHVLTYCNAGQPYPILYSASTNTIEILRQNGFAIGMFEDATYEIQTIDVGQGDTILTYTDGLFDGRAHRDSQTNYDDLTNYFLTYQNIAYENTQEFFTILLRLFAGVSDGHVVDDIAMMLVRIK